MSTQINKYTNYSSLPCARKRAVANDQKMRNSPPTKEDIIVCRQILKDMGINVVIPTFATYRELENWKKNKIMEVLHNG